MNSGGEKASESGFDGGKLLFFEVPKNDLGFGDDAIRSRDSEVMRSVRVIYGLILLFACVIDAAVNGGQVERSAIF